VQEPHTDTHDDHREQRNRDQQSQEPEQDCHHRLNQDRQRRREIEAFLHQNRNQDVILKELDRDVRERNEQRFFR